jgi:ATP-dependent RNA helicase DDX56/DBP9
VVLKDSVQAVVVDEADFMLSYGFEDDMKQIVQRLPAIFQGFLMSATLSTVRFVR